MKSMFKLAVLTILAAAPAFGSSEEAWDEFRQTVAASCAELVQTPDGWSSTVEVNPFGSESYGAALITLGDGKGQVERLICIFDKSSGKAELTGPFATTGG